MRRTRRKFMNWLAVAVFFLVVGVSGYALASSGNLDNPISALTMGGGHSGGGRSEGGGERHAPPSQSSGTGSAPVARGQGRGFGGGEGGGDGFVWSALPSVLSNLWILAAITAVVMVVQVPTKWLFRTVRRRRVPYIAST